MNQIRLNKLVSGIRAGLVAAFGYILLVGQAAPAKKISPQEANRRIQSGSAVLVDVRESDEIAGGMAKPARWMPISKMEEGNPKFDQFLNSLPDKKQLVFYCRSGNRSERAAQKMKSRGYEVFNMGGYSDWTGAGLPTREPDAGEKN